MSGASLQNFGGLSSENLVDAQTISHWLQKNVETACRAWAFDCPAAVGRDENFVSRMPDVTIFTWR